MTSPEIWRPVPDFPGYEISADGRVRSLKGRLTRELATSVQEGGYLFVHLWHRGVGVKRYVHRLVAEAFHGPGPAGHEVRHLNGDSSDNRSENLRWGTRSENNYDRVRHGTHPNSAKQECPSGHRFDEANTRLYRGHRYCRACQQKRSRDYKRRARAEQRGFQPIPSGGTR